jgi:uncharacterized protein
MRKVNRKVLMILLAALLYAPWAANVADAAASADERPMVMVEKGRSYHVVYDIHSDATEAGVSKGLYYARGLYQAFGKQGVEPRQVDVHLVLHGEAAAMLLKDSTYQATNFDPFINNPNDQIVQELLQLGASVEICHSAMKSHGWKAEDVMPGVTIVHDGYTRLVQLQNQGYAYIGGF